MLCGNSCVNLCYIRGNLRLASNKTMHKKILLFNGHFFFYSAKNEFGEEFLFCPKKRDSQLHVPKSYFLQKECLEFHFHFWFAHIIHVWKNEMHCQKKKGFSPHARIRKHAKLKTAFCYHMQKFLLFVLIFHPTRFLSLKKRFLTRESFHNRRNYWTKLLKFSQSFSSPSRKSAL